MYVTKIPWGAAFHKRHHLTCRQIREAVEQYINPRCGCGWLKLRRTLCDLEAEAVGASLRELNAHHIPPFPCSDFPIPPQCLLDELHNLVAIISSRSIGPPGIDIVGLPIIIEVQ